MKRTCIFKILILISVLLANSISCYSQLTVDAGTDTTYCIGLYADTVYLGTNAIIKDGAKPYSIAWECKVPKGLYSYYTASDLLNDTTFLSPLFLYYPNPTDWIKCTLHVTDNENNYAKDSINIRFSQFGYVLGYFEVTLNQGDSVLLTANSVGGGIEPLRYQYLPSAGLSNPNESVTWAKPDTTILYSQVATDSCGCVSVPNAAYYVTVIPTGIDNKGAIKKNLNINQYGNKVNFNNPFQQTAQVSIFSVNGTLVNNHLTSNNSFELSDLIKTKGIYIIKIEMEQISDQIKVTYR